MKWHWGKEENCVYNPVQLLSGLSCSREAFIEASVKNLYFRIFYAVLEELEEREKYEKTCISTYSPYREGLFEILTDAIYNQKSIQVKKKWESNTKAYIFEEIGVANDPLLLTLDFSEYTQALVLKSLFGLMYDVVDSLQIGVKSSKAIYLTLEGLTEFTEGNAGKEVIKQLESQLEGIKKAFDDGGIVGIDGSSKVNRVTFDSKPAKDASAFTWSMIANQVGMPLSFINSEVVSGLGSQESGDREKKRSGIAYYHTSIIKPVLEEVYAEKGTQNLDLKAFVADPELLKLILPLVSESGVLSEKGKRKYLKEYLNIEGDEIEFEEKVKSGEVTD